MDMNRDNFIKNKFKEDKYISKQANDVFKKFEDSILTPIEKHVSSGKVIRFNKFNSDINSNTNRDELNNLSNNNDNEQSNKAINISQNINNTDNSKSNYNLDSLFYKRMNRILSVAAVSLCAIVVGTGTMLYNRKPQTENINIITKSISVRNEELRLSNEQIVKENENNLIKAMLTGDNEVAIQLKQDFISLYNLNLPVEKQYKVNNINKNVKDLFVGNIISDKLPYVMLLMEDDTIEYVKIIDENANIKEKYEFNFYSQGRVLGLYDVVGFEQQKRQFSYSNDYYYYINAVRIDGKRKEIELENYNNWEDNETKIFDKLNQKYIDAYELNKSKTDDQGNEDNSRNNREGKEEYKEKYKDKKLFTLPKDSSCAYYIENESLYKIDIATNTEKCMVMGVVGYELNNIDGKMTVILYKDFSIIEYDSNCLYKQANVGSYTSSVAIIQKYGVKLELKQDGTIVMMINPGGLEQLGISKDETTIRENVMYNIYGAGEGVSEGKRFTNADAKKVIFENVGSSNTISIVYLKKDGTVVCMDIVEAIKTSNLYLTKKIIKDIDNIEGFTYDVSSKAKDGSGEYRTIWIIQKQSDGSKKNIELFYDD